MVAAMQITFTSKPPTKNSSTTRFISLRQIKDTHFLHFRMQIHVVVVVWPMALLKFTIYISALCECKGAVQRRASRNYRFTIKQALES